MRRKKHNIFERNRRKTIALIILSFALGLTGLSELLLRKVMGLGDPVLYDSSPIYGYRPLPNKEYTRFRRAKIKFNNLALRAENDWDDEIQNKVLFLGDSVTYGGSYIDNRELFSHLAVKDLTAYESGNAGVNGWGVENIYGLIVESNFLPAQVYVTVVPEGDFYRGLTRIQGLPFFNNPPKLALAELWFFYCCDQNNKRYRSWHRFADEEQIASVVEKAVQKLKQMDAFLKGKGFKHLIFITPSASHLLNDIKEPTRVERMLSKHNLKVIYIEEKLSKFNFSDKEVKSLYHDKAHLTKKGHEIWAEIIRDELSKLIN